MRPSTLCLSLAFVALTPTAFAQNSGDPVGAAVNALGGVLGNSPGTTTTASRRSSSRSRRGSPALGTPLAANAPRTVLTLAADGYMNLPLETFNTMRSVHPPPFNWAGEGCRFGEITGPFRESFNRACNRQDFGYHNYGAGGLALDTTETRRTRIDDRLHDDLNGICRSNHAGITETPCLAAAQAIYAASRATGWPWFFNNAAPPPSIPTPGVPGFQPTNTGPIPGVPVPGMGGSNGGNNGLPSVPGMGGGNGLPVPGMGGGNGLPIPGMQQAGGPAQVLTAPAQVLNGGR